MSLRIMYSDVISKIQYESDEAVTLEDDVDVATKVKSYLEKNFVEKTVELKEISIHLLSYTNPPQLPSDLPCKNWKINCESHTPYVINLLNSIPQFCDSIEIRIDNGGFVEIAKTESVVTAKYLKLTTAEGVSAGISGVQLRKFHASEFWINGVEKTIDF